jgi:MFS family permease
VLLRIRGKPGITKCNLLIVPLLTFLLMFTTVDVLQTSGQLLQLTYGFDAVQAAKINTNVMTYAAIFSIFVLLLGGIIYDLLGRRATVAIMFIIGALTSAPLPYGQDLRLKTLYFTFFKVVFNSTVVPLMLNPFINDYVQVQDRGLAMGMQNFGVSTGSLLSVAGLYTLTSKLAPDVAFSFLALLQILWVVIFTSSGMI